MKGDIGLGLIITIIVFIIAAFIAVTILLNVGHTSETASTGIVGGLTSAFGAFFLV